MKKNPFPGMNPWLESHWGDVHTSLTTYARDQLQPQLPAGLRARIEEYVAVEADEPSDDSRPRFSPDVRVIERPEAPAAASGVGTSAAVAVDPLIVPREVEPETLHYLQIVDLKAGHKIVTSIEFLSRSNKSSEEGRQQYHAKQRSMLAGGVNLVEIDLLRGGSWVLAVSQGAVPQRYRQPYRISVVRGHRQSVAEVYRASLERPLPEVGIPLRPDDSDVLLQLQSLIDLAYTNGRYYDDVDYREDPEPPLTGSHVQWADQLLRDQGMR